MDEEQIYDVALWRYWSENMMPYTDFVSAPSPLVAALRLMARYKLCHVSRAAVGLPDGSIWRKENGLSRYMEKGVVQDVPLLGLDELKEGVID